VVVSLLNGLVAPSQKVCKKTVLFGRGFNLNILQGIGQGRITDNLATFVKELSGAFTVPDSKSIAMLYELLDSEGLYLGASSALNVVAAVELAQKLGPG